MIVILSLPFVLLEHFLYKCQSVMNEIELGIIIFFFFYSLIYKAPPCLIYKALPQITDKTMDKAKNN